ncbi:ThiF family adenylyltransferase [Pseudoxanthomonas sp. PXM02]|uniref:ThiF family adenylyltransferase n=1 Tax=Pseudoxanthomonas sp. PXM02 TaxID=2769294 RepID=UPI00177DD11A|nr:ThiF family adenylyltransferase [Pseudoxanthomonas sp. PXM02]MBD9477389.1 ThiF family adenylyltransferase [Pseudoxanthomonas sp. PXM02]
MASLNPWFLEDLARFKREREGLAGLVARSEGITLQRVRFDDGHIAVDVDLDIGHRVFEAVLRYPTTFPHSPPSVRPRNSGQLWSGHQYGAGGELCLEYRPDNWLPEIMGWQMVESAYRLLQGENPLPDQHQQVASAHQITEGQRLRSTYSRIPFTRSLMRKFAELAPGQGARGKSLLYIPETNLVRIISSLQVEGEAWSDPEVPSLLGPETWEVAAYVRRLAPGELFPSVESYEEFSPSASKLGWEASDRTFVLLDGDQVRAYSVFDAAVYSMEPIFPPKEAARVSAAHTQLADRTVAILGCGSVGSKIAAMLARAGVSNFVLIDDDILAADNLVRHELDWRDVGQHKAQALSNRIRRIHPDVKVRTRFQQLAGQDSPSAAENILGYIAEADLIIDATANPAVGNIMSEFTRTARIPLVWVEVFAGGVGGIVARHRPGVEPSIALMRRAIESWFSQRVSAPQSQGYPYERSEDGVPLIADDADVSSIAASAARLAIDTLIRHSSDFPHAIYVIGLAPCDLFDQPFETHPILLPPAPLPVASPELTAQEMGEQLEFLGSMIEKAREQQ